MAFTGYYYKFPDSWTPPAYFMPRWFSANSYPTLTDGIESPIETTTTSGSLVNTLNIVPSSWILTSSSPISGGLFQRLWECFTNEKEYLSRILPSLLLTRSLFYDVSEPEYAWLVESEDKCSSLYVQTELGSALVSVATDDLDLFYGAGWRWKQDSSIILICGLDIQQMTTSVDSSDWQFIPFSTIWSSGSTSYLEHPDTKNWFPIHPMSIRSDGWLGFNYSQPLRVRSSNPDAAKLLNEVTVWVNGVQKTARLVSLDNSLDDKAQFFHVSRRDRESNSSLSDTILQSSWFRSQSIKGVRNYISASLRTGIVSTFSSRASGFSLPASATGFSIRNIDQYIYRTENQLLPYLSNSYDFHSLYSNVDLGCGYLNGVETSFSHSPSGIVVFDTYTNNQVDSAGIRWRVRLWTETASSVTFDAVSEVESNLIVLFPTKVNVTSPSSRTLSQSFNRTSPIFKWQNTYLDVGEIQGLAEFDF